AEIWAGLDEQNRGVRVLAEAGSQCRPTGARADDEIVVDHRFSLTLFDDDPPSASQPRFAPGRTPVLGERILQTFAAAAKRDEFDPCKIVHVAAGVCADSERLFQRFLTGIRTVG